MSNLDEIIGKRLRIARKARGYKSARAFALEQDVPESTYSQHETGKRSLNPETTMRYCRALDIDPNWLFVGDDASMSKEEPVTPVHEVTLNTSFRQQPVVQAPAKQVTIDVTILKDALEKAIARLAASGNVNVDSVIADCVDNKQDASKTAHAAVRPVVERVYF